METWSNNQIWHINSNIDPQNIPKHTNHLRFHNLFFQNTHTHTHKQKVQQNLARLRQHREPRRQTWLLTSPAMGGIRAWKGGEEGLYGYDTVEGERVHGGVGDGDDGDAVAADLHGGGASRHRSLAGRRRQCGEPPSPPATMTWLTLARPRDLSLSLSENTADRWYSTTTLLPDSGCSTGFNNRND